MMGGDKQYYYKIANAFEKIGYDEFMVLIHHIMGTTNKKESYLYWCS